MMTKNDADELISAHLNILKGRNNPMERTILDSAMVQTLGQALRDKTTTPELVAYVIEGIFDKQCAEAVENFRADPMLAILGMVAQAICEDEDEE